MSSWLRWMLNWNARRFLRDNSYCSYCGAKTKMRIYASTESHSRVTGRVICLHLTTECSRDYQHRYTRPDDPYRGTLEVRCGSKLFDLLLSKYESGHESVLTEELIAKMEA